MYTYILKTPPQLGVVTLNWYNTYSDSLWSKHLYIEKESSYTAWLLKTREEQAKKRGLEIKTRRTWKKAPTFKFISDHIEANPQ